jgi:hypothetical protein
MENPINVEIYKGLTKKIFIKDNCFHYGNTDENSSISMEPIKIENATLEKIKQNIIKTDIFKFIEFIGVGEEDKMDQIIKKAKRESTKKQEQLSQQKKQVITLEDKEKKEKLKDTEQVQQLEEVMKVIRDQEKGLVPYYKMNDLQLEEFRKSLKGAKEKLEKMEQIALVESFDRQYKESGLYNLPIDILNVIIKMLYLDDQFTQRKMSSVRQLYYASKALSLKFYDLFMVYLTFSPFFYRKDPLGREPKHLIFTHKPVLPILPKDLKGLTLIEKVNIDFKVLPQTLKYLVLGDWFNGKLTHLPKSLESLKLGNGFNKKESLKSLPKSLKTLVIGDGYEKDIHGILLLPNLETLQLGAQFNNPVDELPKGLKNLKLGTNFKKTVDNLPEKLKRLEINSASFNQSIDNLPVELIFLSISSYNYHLSFDGLYNKKIESLVLDLFDYTLPIDKLPVTLKKFTLKGNEWNNTLDNLPNSLEYLNLELKKINRDIYYFPENLLTLIMKCSNFDSSLINRFKKLKVFEFKSIYYTKNFLFIDNFGNYHPIFPDSLQTLSVSNSRSFNIVIPKFVKNLFIMNTSSIGYINLSDSITHLELILPVVDFKRFPKNLENLTIRSRYFNPDYSILPEGLKVLNVYLSHDFGINFLLLPISIEKVRIPEEYSEAIFGVPDSLKEITLSSKYPHLKNLKALYPQIKLILY